MNTFDIENSCRHCFFLLHFLLHFVFCFEFIIKLVTNFRRICPAINLFYIKNREEKSKLKKVDLISSNHFQYLCANINRIWYSLKNKSRLSEEKKQWKEKLNRKWHILKRQTSVTMKFFHSIYDGSFFRVSIQLKISHWFRYQIYLKIYYTIWNYVLTFITRKKKYNNRNIVLGRKYRKRMNRKKNNIPNIKLNKYCIFLEIS